MIEAKLQWLRDELDTLRAEGADTTNAEQLLDDILSEELGIRHIIYDPRRTT